METLNELNEPSEILEVQDGDVVTDGDEPLVLTQTKREKTGYPDNLTESEIVRLIYFFGSRKLVSRAFSTRGGGVKTKEFSQTEKLTINKILEWYDLVPANSEEFKKAYNHLTLRFKAILAFLKKSPAYITTNIHKALTTAGYKSVTTAVVLAYDTKTKKVVPRTTSEGNAQPPIASADKLMWNLQNVTLDKMMLVASEISPADIKKANLGVKSKALRDLMSVYHMMRLNNKAPNPIMMQVNIGTSSVEQNLSTFSSYIQKNREEK